MQHLTVSRNLGEERKLIPQLQNAIGPIQQANQL